MDKKGEKPKKQIIFFSFYSRDKFIYLVKDESLLEKIEHRSEEFHKFVMDFALGHPEIKVIIKTKMSKHYVDYVKDILANNFKKDIPNLEITNFGNAYNMIKNSFVVIGFSSLTLIEALADDKMIISPYFGDLITDRDWDYFKAYPELVNYAKNYPDLERYILNPTSNLKNNAQQKVEFLEEMISTPDGKASLRTEAAIIEVINQFKSNK